MNPEEKSNKKLSKSELLVLMGVPVSIPGKPYIKLVIEYAGILNKKLKEGRHIDSWEMSKYGISAANLLISEATLRRPYFELTDSDKEILLDFLTNTWRGKKSQQMLQRLKKLLKVRDELSNWPGLSKEGQLKLSLKSKIIERAGLVSKEYSRIRKKEHEKLNQDFRRLINDLRSHSTPPNGDYREDLQKTMAKAAKDMNSASKLFYSVKNDITDKYLKEIRKNKKEVISENLDDFAEISTKIADTGADEAVEDLDRNRYLLRDQATDYMKTSKDGLKRWARAGLLKRYWSADIELRNPQPKGRWLYKLEDITQEKIMKIKKSLKEKRLSALNKK